MVEEGGDEGGRAFDLGEGGVVGSWGTVRMRGAEKEAPHRGPGTRLIELCSAKNKQFDTRKR